MAEGWARYLKSESLQPFSAGLEAHGLNPYVVKVMREEGVDISRQKSQHMEAMETIPFDVVVTVCGHADANCPVFSCGTVVIYRGFDDPSKLAKTAKTEEEGLGHYRRVRDEIRAFIETLPEGLY